METERLEILVQEEDVTSTFIAPTNPLTIEMIRDKVLSSMAAKDLRSARLVCKDWTFPATKEHRQRSVVFGRVTQMADDDQAAPTDEESINKFVSVMRTCSFMPVTRLSFSVDLLSLPPQSLIQLLTFSAPWVEYMNVICIYSSSDPTLDNQKTSHALELNFKLAELNGVAFPALKELTLDDKHYPEEDFNEPVVALLMATLAKLLVAGSKELKTLEYWICLEDKDECQRSYTKMITQSLPSTLKRLTFMTCRDSSVDYEALTECNLELEEFAEAAKPHSIHHFFEFLRRQGPFLRKLELALLVSLFQEFWRDFPEFQFVNYLEIEVKANSSFECIKQFPTLLKLEVNVREVDEEDEDDNVVRADDNNLRHHFVHPQLQQLRISPDNSVASMPSFALFSHCFPNLRHLDFECAGLWRDLPHLFNHLQQLDTLQLSFNPSSSPAHPDLEPIIAGLPLTVGQGELKYDFFGLANLKRLTVLKILATSQHNEFILTEVNLNLCFSRMKGLKKLWMGGWEGEVQAYEVGRQPIVDAIKAIVYEMK